MYQRPLTSGELYHHGILGQKWGVRRYQNADGTLTAAGRKRLKKSGYDDITTAKQLDKEVSEYDKGSGSEAKAKAIDDLKAFGKASESLWDESQEVIKRVDLDENDLSAAKAKAVEEFGGSKDNVDDLEFFNFVVQDRLGDIYENKLNSDPIMSEKIKAYDSARDKCFESINSYIDGFKNKHVNEYISDLGKNDRVNKNHSSEQYVHDLLYQNVDNEMMSALYSSYKELIYYNDDKFFNQWDDYVKKFGID